MNGRDKLSIIPFTFFFFLGLYVVIKFFLVLFWTLNFNTKIILELTPFFLFGMNPVQLLVLSAIVAGSDAYFHFKNHGWNIVISFVPTVIMLIGIGAAIYASEWNNPFYYTLFAIMLGVTIVDHRYLLKINGYIREEEGEEEVETVEEAAEEGAEEEWEEITPAEEVSEVEVEEVSVAPEEEREIEEILEAEKIEEELREMPEEEREHLEEVPEIPKDMIGKIERHEIAAREEEKVEPKTEPAEMSKEEREKTIEELLEELLEATGKKREMEKGKECPICGAMNSMDAKYCKECGSELEEGA